MQPPVGDEVTFGPLMFRVLRLFDNVQVEREGMSVALEKAGFVVNQQREANK